MPQFCNHCGFVGNSLESCSCVNGRNGGEEKGVRGSLRAPKSKPPEGEWISIKSAAGGTECGGGGVACLAVPEWICCFGGFGR